MAVEPIRNVMEKDYAAIIRRKLDDVYRGSAHGGGQRNEKNERESFIVRITNFRRSRRITDLFVVDPLERSRHLGITHIPSHLRYIFLPNDTPNVPKHRSSSPHIDPLNPSQPNPNFQSPPNNLSRPALQPTPPPAPEAAPCRDVPQHHVRPRRKRIRGGGECRPGQEAVCARVGESDEWV
jgi:hypothetical protein